MANLGKRKFSKTPSETEGRLGELYRKITLTREDFNVEQELEKTKEIPYIALSKKLNSLMPNLTKETKLTKEHKEALDFLKWNLKDEEFANAINVFSIFSLGLALLLGLLIFLIPFISEPIFAMFPDVLIAYLFIFGIPIVLALGGIYFFRQYPIMEADKEKNLALSYVPQIIGYMVMSMKLVPNIEKAIEFASKSGTGKLVEDLREISWNMKLGAQGTIYEALDALAYRWGKYSEELKQALMRVRSSLMENDQALRMEILDKTMNELLTSVKNKMEMYAKGLTQKTVVLFYVGVLLPLILVIILPVGSAFSGSDLARAEYMFLLYNVILPAGLLFYSMIILSERPHTNEPPEIDDTYPGLPKKNYAFVMNTQIPILLIVLGVLAFGSLGSLFISSNGIPPTSIFGDKQDFLLAHDQSEKEVLERENLPENWFNEDGGRYKELLGELGSAEKAQTALQDEKQKFFIQAGNDTTPYNLIFGLIITISFAISSYMYFSARYKRKIQKEIQKMEEEFEESLYVISSRLAENKPMETALKYTKDFFPNYTISQVVYKKTLDNVELLGMPLEKAFFDKTYGSLKYVPSKIIRSSLKILVDSVSLSVSVASKSLMSMAMQLTNLKKVNATLHSLIGDTTQTMTTMILFISPVVLGITTALQKIVIGTLSSIAASGVLENLNNAGVQDALTNASIEMPTITTINASAVSSIASPAEFLIMIALYIIELVLIMTYFTTKIDTENSLEVRINIARNLPIATIIFCISVIVANSVVGTM